MWLYSIVTYLHFISVFILFSALILELSIIKEEMTRNSILTFRKADLFFGIFAGLTVLTGLLRVYNLGKGFDYYLSNPLFVLKLSLFILIGLISIYPTIYFLKIKKSKRETEKIKYFKLILLLIRLELALLLLIPFFGVLVANGIGI